jgi:hypothetical protein
VSNPSRRRDGHHRLRHMHQVEKDYRAARRLVRDLRRMRNNLPRHASAKKVVDLGLDDA